MLKSVKRAALLIVLLTAGASRANAITTSWSWQGCGGAGGPGFNTCASVNVQLVGSVLTIVVQNWGNLDPNTSQVASNSGASVFASIGISNFGTGNLGNSSGFSASCLNDSSCSWAFDPNLSSLNGYSGANASPPPSSFGLNPPASPGFYRTVTLTFVTSGSIDLANATFALHGVSGPADPAGGNCSTKLIVTRNGSTYTPNGTNGANATTCLVDDPIIDQQVAPEPASMLLLATGLVAMGGAGFMRRRKV